MGYPLDAIYEEVAYIAYHFHWSYADIMNMEHSERKKWVGEISKINLRHNTLENPETGYERYRKI